MARKVLNRNERGSNMQLPPGRVALESFGCLSSLIVAILLAVPTRGQYRSRWRCKTRGRGARRPIDRTGFVEFDIMQPFDLIRYLNQEVGLVAAPPDGACRGAYPDENQKIVAS